MQGVLEQGTKLTKMGADMGLMTKAMGMANAGNDKARQADTANALVPAKKKARAGFMTSVEPAGSSWTAAAQAHRDERRM